MTVENQQANWARSDARAAGTPDQVDPWAAVRWRPAPVGILLSEVEPEFVSWLWQDRIAFGKLTLLDGDPGQLKSTIALDLAARVSTGRPMPDGAPGAAGGVVILSAEDGLADTIRPRVDAAGGDPGRIVAVIAVGDGSEARLPVLPFDLPTIEQAMDRVEARLLIVDPLMAYLGAEVNAYRDQDVRRALAQLTEMAERRQVAAVVIRHLNKSQGVRALYRGGGSIGIAGAARSVLLVGEDQEHPDDRVLAVVKSNLGPKPPSLRYRAVQAANGAVAVAWLGTTTATADMLLAQGEANGAGAVADAEDFLDGTLADGPMPYRDLRREARSAGISEATLRRAKKARGVTARKIGMTEGWAWELPPPRLPPLPEDDQPPEGDHLRQDDHLRQVAPVRAGGESEDDHAPEGDQRLITFDEPDGTRASPIRADDPGCEGDHDLITFGPAAAEDDHSPEDDHRVGVITFDGPDHLPAGEPSAQACPDCAKPLDPTGNCWTCDYGLCRDCGERTPSAVLISCPRHQVKPATGPAS